MCRNIRTLFNFEPPASEQELRAAALQFVRKLSGFNAPSRANEAAFEMAVQEVTASAQRLIANLVTHTGPRDRETEVARLRDQPLRQAAQPPALLALKPCNSSVASTRSR